jgi:hypothetical protein
MIYDSKPLHQFDVKLFSVSIIESNALSIQSINRPPVARVDPSFRQAVTFTPHQAEADLHRFPK